MFTKLKQISIIGIFFLTLAVFANEDEHGGGGGGGHAESGGGGHAEGSKGGGGTALKGSLPPWVEVEAKISALETKVKAKEGNINKLLEEKNHLDAKSPKMKEFIDEISKEHKEMREAAEELEKQRTILHYRYPERSADPKRQYQKTEIKSVQEMEANVGLDGRLQRTFKRAQQQYGSKWEPESAKRTKKNEAEKKVHEEGSVILQK